MHSSALIFLLVSSLVWAKRPFDVLLGAYECFPNPVYIENMSCFADRKLNMAGISFQLGRDLTDLRFTFDVVLFKKNNESYTLFNVTDGDGCAFLEGKSRITLLNIARAILAKSGVLPAKCPISKGLQLEFRNLSIDAENFPPYVPETKFCVNVTITQHGDLVFKIRILGEVVHKTTKTWWG